MRYTIFFRYFEDQIWAAMWLNYCLKKDFAHLNVCGIALLTENDMLLYIGYLFNLHITAFYLMVGNNVSSMFVWAYFVYKQIIIYGFHYRAACFKDGLVLKRCLFNFFDPWKFCSHNYLQSYRALSHSDIDAVMKLQCTLRQCWCSTERCCPTPDTADLVMPASTHARAGACGRWMSALMTALPQPTNHPSIHPSLRWALRPTASCAQ